MLILMRPSAGSILAALLNLTSGTNHPHVMCTHNPLSVEGFNAPPGHATMHLEWVTICLLPPINCISSPIKCYSLKAADSKVHMTKELHMQGLAQAQEIYNKSLQCRPERKRIHQKKNERSSIMKAVAVTFYRT